MVTFLVHVGTDGEINQTIIRLANKILRKIEVWRERSLKLSLLGCSAV